MMKYLIRSVIIIIFSYAYVAKAQDAAVAKNDMLKVRKAQNINLEIGGPGFFYSINYDTRFSEQRGGFGARLGFGIWTPNTQKFYTFPFQINYLIGGKRNFLELGAGVTFLVRNPPTNHLKFLSTTINSNVFATSTIGYRFQSLRSGINFRASLNPMYADHTFLPNFGFGVGYTFR
jgi:hypothetical protein